MVSILFKSFDSNLVPARKSESKDRESGRSTLPDEPQGPAGLTRYSKGTAQRKAANSPPPPV